MNFTLDFKFKYKWTWWLSRLEFWVRHIILITHQGAYVSLINQFLRGATQLNNLTYADAALIHEMHACAVIIKRNLWAPYLSTNTNGTTIHTHSDFHAKICELKNLNYENETTVFIFNFKTLRREIWRPKTLELN